MTDLSGKTALVTGGGTGVGAAIAAALAEAGAKTTICGRREEPLKVLAEQHSAMSWATADITDEVAVTELFEARGPFDIVIANAGAAQSAPLARTDLAQWQRMIDVNLTGTFLTLREAQRALGKADWGRLIAIASTAGLKGYGYVAPYCAAKHGVVGLIRALALETAGRGITANAVCPGFTETPLLEESIANIVAKTGQSEADARAALTKTNPLGRFIQPEEVAAAVLWLVGNGSDAITGQAISVSGGETW
ncbi:MAG: SDR family NAD(P)-dependent oxidoreductase [Pseudomonadota bacterium]